jgi:hypothetical protein
MTLLQPNPTEKRRLLTPTIEILKSGLFGRGYLQWKQEGEIYFLFRGLNVDITREFLQQAFQQLMKELGVVGATLQDTGEPRIGVFNQIRTNLIVTIPKTEFESKIKPNLHATCAKQHGDLSTNIRDLFSGRSR